MRLYLVRHGDAAHPAIDPTRPLSARGRSDIERLAAWMATQGVAVNEILHSPKRRAFETAEIIAAALGPTNGLRESAGLQPNDDPQAALDLLRFEAAPVMAVSHLPLVDLVALRLSGGRPPPAGYSFRPGTAAAFRSDDGPWTCEWLVHPQQLT